VPIKPINVDFERGLNLLPYYLLFPNLGIATQDSGLIITREEYGKGNCLLAFDLNQSESTGPPFALEKTGTVRIELQFSKSLKHAINCIVYSEHQRVLELDQCKQAR